MNELQLVGYTADLAYLVFTEAEDESVRFKLPVDEDLLATMEEVTHLVDPTRAAASAPPEPQEPPPEPPPPEPKGPAPGEGGLAATALLAAADVEPDGEVPLPRESRLSPREIQALLRAGRSLSAVARIADTDEAWVEKWLAPIEAERRQILQAVQQRRITKARLGPSRDPVGEAVRKNLSQKGVLPDDPSVEWRVARRNGADEWQVELRYRSRGRRHRAVWAFDPEEDRLEPRNDLALEIAWTRPRQRSQAAAADSKGKGRKATARKTTAGKPAARQTGSGKATGRKATGRKATAPKPGRRRT